MTSPDVLKQAKTEFDQVTTASPYFAVLPADAKPPLDLNKAMMQQFRPEMAKYYLHKTPRYN
jgi:aminobenzoyl-glutamate utilization protein B